MNGTISGESNLQSRENNNNGEGEAPRHFRIICKTININSIVLYVAHGWFVLHTIVIYNKLFGSYTENIDGTNAIDWHMNVC